MGFNLDNTVNIEGQVWPDSLTEINLQIGKGRTSFERETKEELIRNADSLLVATIDHLTLIERLKIFNRFFKSEQGHEKGHENSHEYIQRSVQLFV